MLLAVFRSSLEYRNEVWDCDKGQADAIIPMEGDVALKALNSEMNLGSTSLLLPQPTAGGC